MEKFELNDMTKGWLIGDFIPSVFRTKDFEVGIKKINAGEYETSHYHKLAVEITVIIFGEAVMNNVNLKENDIIVLKKNEKSDFKAITDVVLMVIKIPSIKYDKYM